MTKILDLTDIQGNIVRAYGRFGFPKARYFFLRIDDGDKGREFVSAVIPRITSSVEWGVPGGMPKPQSTLNIAFTFDGIRVLGVPQASLRGFPEEFIMGMRRRWSILGDDGPSGADHWDPIWKEPDIHVWMSVNGQDQNAVEACYGWVKDLIGLSDGGVVLLTGHRGDNGQDDLPYQDASLLTDENGNYMPTEHFHYTDGISDPVFEGQTHKLDAVIGQGKPTPEGGWAPLATGEFLLGHPDEAREYAAAPMPMLLSRNGTYMAYRKLHQNVGSFERLLEESAKNYPGDESLEDKKELLAAKFSGRWRKFGTPIVNAPDIASKKAWDEAFLKADKQEQNRMLTDFAYDNTYNKSYVDDLGGTRCPFSAHVRRINPRGSLEFGQKGAYDTPGALDIRRRIMRRGLPYGASSDRSRDDGNHGIVFMAVGASLKRQFEFVQQQWINYGNDFKQASDKDILLGNHSPQSPSKFVIPAEPNSGRSPYFVKDIPRLVETRGGEYFFIPSLTALRMIAKGIVDPT